MSYYRVVATYRKSGRGEAFRRYLDARTRATAISQAMYLENVERVKSGKLKLTRNMLKISATIVK